MNLEYLSRAHHRLHRLLLRGGNESLRQFQLCDDHDGYGWFLYPQQQYFVLPFAGIGIHLYVLLLPLGSELHPALCSSHQVQDQGSVQELGVQVLYAPRHRLYGFHHGRADGDAQLRYGACLPQRRLPGGFIHHHPGLFNDDAALWPHVTWVILAACMFFGACSGSTSGGLKCIRAVMLVRMVKNEFRQILHPNAVLPLKIDGVNVPMQKRVTLLAFLTTYLIICLVISFTMIAMGIDNTNAITITLSCVGNVGPTLGTEIGPTMSWSELPDVAKWFCSLMMLIGRLEIFSVLVIFTPAFWREN